MHTLTEIPVTDLRPLPFNPRKTFRAIDELAADIAQRGVLTPLLVRPNGKGFEIVAGERRWRAAKQVKLAALPCIVRELDDQAALEVAVIENLQREDVHPVEEAEGFRQLHEQHGLSADDIAAKVGKSKAYVYGRLKLCALTAKGKKAALEGKVSPSVALLLARIPEPKLQDKALAELTRPSYDGELPSFRRARYILERSFTCDLKAAGFDLTDATLVPSAGACTTCPHRTGNQRELFDGAAGESADVCTNPPCFDQKREAAWQRRKEAAEAKGLKVLSDKEARKAIADYYDRKSAYVDLDVEAGTADYKKWRTLLGKAATPEKVLARDTQGRVHELVPRATAQRLLKERHPELAKQSASRRPPEERAREAKARRMRAVRSAALSELAAAAAKSNATTEPFWRAVADAVIALASHEALTDTIKRRELGKAGHSGESDRTIRAAAAKMKPAELRGLIVELLAYQHIGPWSGSDQLGPRLRGFCKLYGVDLKKVEREAAPAKKKARKR